MLRPPGYDQPVATRTPTEDIVQEAQEVMNASDQGAVGARLLGGIAIRLRTPGGLHPAFERSYKDIDLVAPRRSGKELSRMLTGMGYEANTVFNATNGNRRLLFYDNANGRQLDVFLGTFEMCHAVPLGDRLDVDPLTVPLAELLLTKLQIVQLNEKDRRDSLALLFHHPVADHDQDAVNGARVADLLAADWGLWRTTTMNLAKARDSAPEYALSNEERQRILDRIAELEAQIEAAPKSTKWKLRDRVGDRKRWYEEPEEVD